MKELCRPQSPRSDCIRGFQGEPAVSTWSAFHVRLTIRPLRAHSDLASRPTDDAGGGAGRRTEARGRSELLQSGGSGSADSLGERAGKLLRRSGAVEQRGHESAGEVDGGRGGSAVERDSHGRSDADRPGRVE